MFWNVLGHFRCFGGVFSCFRMLWDTLVFLLLMFLDIFGHFEMFYDVMGRCGMFLFVYSFDPVGPSWTNLDQCVAI